MAKKQKRPLQKQRAAPAAPVKSPVDRQAPQAEPTESVSHLFRREDWFAAALAALISGLIFFHHMAPEVTLQDSGELVTGAFTFGVPHPPGYPLWAFLGFIWCHFIVPFGNPAWRIGLMSVVTGALVVGVLTITMTRSVRLLLHSLPWSPKLDEKLLHWIALATGVSTALLFGFNRGVWLWACVSEMRVLNVFSFTLIMCTFFGWAMQPHRRGFLYATQLIFGLSMANHQTVAVMALPLAVGTFAVGLEQYMEARKKDPKGRSFSTFMTSFSSFWELAAAGLLCIAVALIVLAWLQAPPATDAVMANPLSKGVLAGIAGAVLIVVGLASRWWRARRAFACAGMVLAGVSFYLYMPLAAWTNPPMNWGYAGTKEGFLHAIARGQYEKMHTANFLSSEFFLKIKIFSVALWAQYSFTILLGLVVLVAMILCWSKMRPACRAWLIIVWAAFFATSFGLLTIINPKVDRQEQEITIKFFAPAHGFYAMLIGYGLAVLLSLGAAFRTAFARVVVRLACIGILAMPLVTYRTNWSLCALGGYDFGYLFGYLMFNPGGDYQPMDRDAVLYGGTDPGRFVPTYMIFCESRVAPGDRHFDKNFDRSDVYIITQNALADQTYMCYIRDHYDYSRPKNKKFFQRLLHRDHTYPVEPIYIPSPEDSNLAFKQYVDDVHAGRIAPSADLKIDEGRVTVQGVGGVMIINGILAEMIFDRNKDKHSFYVEESYVIQWMYPYLRPAGVILKIEKEPLPSPEQDPKLWADIAARDRAYWDKLSKDFLAREDFRRNSDAKKSFSKMRSAIAGLYAFRHMMPEAEYAFRQSLDLCPESPESNFRLAELLMQEGRFAEARQLLEAYQKLDVYNSNVREFLANIGNIERETERRHELEKLNEQGRLSLDSAIELAGVYQRLNMIEPFRGLSGAILGNSNLPPQKLVAIAQVCGGARQWDLFATALRRFAEFQPNDYRCWIDLGFAYLMLNKNADARSCLDRAISVGGEAAKAILREDARFGQLRSIPEFRAMLEPANEAPIANMPFGDFR